MSKIKHYNEVYEIASEYFLFPTQLQHLGNKKGSMTNFSSEIKNLLGKVEDSIPQTDKFRQLYGFPRNQFMAVKSVTTTSRLKGADRLVATAVASLYSSKLGYSYPNEKQLADICGISIRAVGHAIEQMKASGEWLIIPTRVAPYEKAVSNRYFILPPAGFGTVALTLEGKITSGSLQNPTAHSIVSDYNTRTAVTLRLKSLFKQLPANLRTVPLFQIDDPLPTPVEIAANFYRPIPRLLTFETSTPALSSKKRLGYNADKYKSFLDFLAK